MTVENHIQLVTQSEQVSCHFIHLRQIILISQVYAGISLKHGTLKEAFFLDHIG